MGGIERGQSFLRLTMEERGEKRAQEIRGHWGRRPPLKVPQNPTIMSKKREPSLGPAWPAYHPRHPAWGRPGAGGRPTTRGPAGL